MLIELKGYLDGYTAAQADLADAIATAAKDAGNVEVAAK